MGSFNVNNMAIDHIENKHTLYRENECLREICSPLRQHAKNVIDFEKEKLLPLTKEELRFRI